MKIIMKTSIVFMVAGLASRFGGDIKQLAKVGPQNETLIELSVKQAIKAGINEIIFVVGEKTQKPFQDMYKNEFESIPIKYAFQEFDKTKRDKPRGTTHALLSAKEIIKNPFIVCNGDDLYGKTSFEILINHLQNRSNPATLGYKLIETLPETGEVNRGIFESQNDIVTGLTENFNISKQNIYPKGINPDSLCSMNIFGLQPASLNKLDKVFKEFQSKIDDRKTESILPTEINKLIKEENLLVELYPSKEKRYGITYPEDEIIVRKQLSKTNLF